MVTAARPCHTQSFLVLVQWIETRAAVGCARFAEVPPLAGTVYVVRALTPTSYIEREREGIKRDSLDATLYCSPPLTAYTESWFSWFVRNVWEASSPRCHDKRSCSEMTRRHVVMTTYWIKDTPVSGRLHFTMYTEQKKYRTTCQVFLPCFLSWNKRSQKPALKIRAQICLHTCSWAFLLCLDNPSTGQVWHNKKLIKQHDH